jgi:hypothetical protein
MDTLKKLGFLTYGTVIPGLMLHGKPAPYPVLNERSVRAGAGIMLVIGIFSVFHAFYLSDFSYLKIAIALFFADFFIKVIVGTRFSPFAIAGDLLVRGQEPEYVGAIQKRFAWSIGLALSSVMMLLVYVFDVRGIYNLAICSLCLTFMFLESSVGFCVGCKIYGALLRYRIIKAPEHRPVCPGNVCAIDSVDAH